MFHSFGDWTPGILADFHCVAGSSVTGLRWEGVPYAAFHHDVLAPRAAGSVTHVKVREIARLLSRPAAQEAHTPAGIRG